jgi:hypothetical protein
MVKMISRKAFDRAADYMRASARPLENALFNFHFSGGNRNQVLAELVPFQNSDGGFGHGLEPDLQTPASSVIATITALAILRDLGSDEDTPGLPAALAYLVGAYDLERERWPIVPPEVEEAPHAPWWGYSQTEENTGGYWANPRASVVAYLQQFHRLAPSPFFESVRQATIDDLMRYSHRMEMHDLLCFVDLLETEELPRESYENVLDKLRRALPQSVETVPGKWGDYGLRPADVVRSPDSPLSGVIDRWVIDKNLDYEIESQEDNGSWAPNWSWDFVDPAAWSAAEKAWRGILTIKKLKILHAYRRVEVELPSE